MDDKKDIKVDCENYYSSVDKTTLDNLCSNNNIKNLIYLSSQIDLNPFNKKNKKWQLKNKEKIIKECEQYKKKEIKEFSFTLSNLAKLGSNSTSDVKNICKNYEDKLENIDKIITYANNIDTIEANKSNLNSVKSKPVELTSKKSNEKTTYLVEHEPNSQSNIVSFDIIGGNQEDKSKLKQTKAEKTNKKTNGPEKETKKIVEIKIKNIKSPTESSDNSDYLECYGNC